MPFKIAIIGGGCTGLTAANSLLNHRIPGLDLQVRVFTKESRSDDYTPRSIQLRLGAMGLGALKDALPQEIFDTYLPQLYESNKDNFKIYNCWYRSFEPIEEIVPAKPPAHVFSPRLAYFLDNHLKDYKIPIFRPSLRKLLHATLNTLYRGRCEVRERRTFESYEQLSSGEIRVDFIGGTSYVADIVLDATGDCSPVAALVGAENHVQHDEMIIMGSIRLRELSQKWENSRFATDKFGTTGYFSLQKSTSGMPPGYNQSGNVVFFVITIPLSVAPRQLTSRKFVKSEWREFGINYLRETGWNDLAVSVVNKCGLGCMNIFRAGSSKLLASNWRDVLSQSGDKRRGNHRVWFLGDALHRMPQTWGIGGNYALSDAVEAAENIRALALRLATEKLDGEALDSAIHDACEMFEFATLVRADNKIDSEFDETRRYTLKDVRFQNPKLGKRARSVGERTQSTGACEDEDTVLVGEGLLTNGNTASLGERRKEDGEMEDREHEGLGRGRQSLEKRKKSLAYLKESNVLGQMATWMP
ncbi:hypothetical protein MMC20_008039 [Loxospora ochrophaea]|nr:hypothetical protein [Loxospora ochrophaea]